MKRITSVPVLVVLVLALALGSISAAVGAPAITKATVKKVAAKVAAKVVKKAAPGLSVASAANASNASNAANLNGQPPSTYLTQAYTAGIGPVTGVPSFNVAIPAVPAGTYQLGLSLNASLSVSASPLFCAIYQVGVAPNLLDVYGAAYTLGRTVHGSRVVTIAATGAIRLECAPSSGTMTVPADGYSPAQVQFLRLDSVTSLGTAAP